MRKNNNKGFTLLELLISIFILTTVIFIGYSIINKSTTYIQNRKNIHEGQLAVNDLNVYLMDDLKCATNVVITSYLTEINTFTDDSTQENEITNDSLKDAFKEYLDNTKDDLSTDIKFSYSYNVDYKKDENDIKQITYNVDIIKENNNYKYSISREATNEVLITFITNKILTEEVLPLKIELESPYEVTLGYTGKNNDEFVEHQLAIASRLFEMSPMPPNLGDIDVPDDWDNFNTIGFWTADSTKKTQDNLYTWVSSETEIIEDAYADQENGRNDNFNIEGYVKYNNNTFTGSYIGYNEIKSDTEWQGQVKDISIGSKKIIDIYIYVSKDTTLKDFKIESDEANITIDEKTFKSSDGIDLETGWHSCKIELNKDSLLNFKFTGKLSIDKSKVSTGYAYVAYQKEDYKQEINDLDGDIIFEYISNDKYNSNMTELTSSINTQEKYGEYKTIYKETNDKDRNQFLRENIIQLMIENNFEMTKVNGKYIKDQTEDTSNLIRVINSPYGNPVITNNKICKDIRDVNKILITCDDNTKLLLSDQDNGDCSIIQKSSKLYELTITKKQPNIKLKFTFNQIDKIENFKISFTFIEEK